MLHPAVVHGDAAPATRRDEAAGRVGILLVNLGTPEAATPAATRRYLAQFLSDPRVVEIPRVAWWPLLHGVVLRTRPAKSARKYAKIWTREGSPLAVYTARQAALLRGYLGERGATVDVRWAMRYGRPAIAAELDALVAQGCSRVLVFPAYPQYCAATTASAFDDVARWLQRTRTLPELRFVNEYHVDSGYLQALAEQVRRHWRAEGRGRPLVLSFHGMPERTRDRGDPYHGQCLETARRLAAALGLADDQVHVTFQSRFGAAAWLRPYTDETLAALARSGCAGVDVMCPGFSCDCLETLEEIAIEGRATFLAAGGQSFHYLSCLNDRPEGMRALTEVALRHLQGWLPACPCEP